MSMSPVPYRSGNHLDDQVNTELMRVCKCVLPYLDRGMQKNLAVSLKVLELFSVFQLYNSETAVSEVPLMRGENWENKLLSEVRNNLDSDKTYIVDALMKLGEFRNIMSHLQPQEDAAPVHFDTEPAPDPAPLGSDPFGFNPFASTNTQTPQPEANTQPRSTSPSPADMLNAFSPLLDDKQKQMINLLSAFMKPNNT